MTEQPIIPAAPAPKAIEPPKPLEETVGSAEIKSLLDQAAATGSESRQLMQPKETVQKSKGGRPRKDANDPKWQKAAEPQAAVEPPPPPPFDLLPACRAVFKVTSRLLVSKTKVAEVALSDDEVEQLATAWNAVAVRYLPNLLGHPELFAACMITGMIGLRISDVLGAEIERRKAEEAKSVVSE